MRPTATILITLILMALAFTTSSSASTAEAQKFQPVNFDTPFVFQTEPNQASYFQFDAANTLIAVSVAIYCGGDVNKGGDGDCAEACVLNMTRNSDNVAHPDWTSSSGVSGSLPSILVSPFTDPPFADGTFYIGFLSQGKNVMSIVVQAFSNGGQKYFPPELKYRR